MEAKTWRLEFNVSGIADGIVRQERLAVIYDEVMKIIGNHGLVPGYCAILPTSQVTYFTEQNREITKPKECDLCGGEPLPEPKPKKGNRPK